VIAGDIGSVTDTRYRDFLIALSTGYKKTFMVCGNHEFYGTEMMIPDTIDYLEKMIDTLPHPFSLLKAGDAAMEIPGSDVMICGSTMWTNVPEIMAPDSDGRLNDYTWIRGSMGAITTYEINSYHKWERDWLKLTLDDLVSENKNTVVVTHHCPSRALGVGDTSRTMDGFGPLYYASDMNPLICYDNIVAWCYGHTHRSFLSTTVNSKFPFITNAFGYPGESTGFVKCGLFRV
jgi:hypothetical protein